jgi:hypothetical protein
MFKWLKPVQSLSFRQKLELGIVKVTPAGFLGLDCKFSIDVEKMLKYIRDNPS